MIRVLRSRKLNNLEDAATDAEIAQEIDPSNVKVISQVVVSPCCLQYTMQCVCMEAYYNRALALQLLEKQDEDAEPEMNCFPQSRHMEVRSLQGSQHLQKRLANAAWQQGGAVTLERR